MKKIYYPLLLTIDYYDCHDIITASVEDDAGEFTLNWIDIRWGE